MKGVPFGFCELERAEGSCAIGGQNGVGYGVHFRRDFYGDRVVGMTQNRQCQQTDKQETRNRTRPGYAKNTPNKCKVLVVKLYFVSVFGNLGTPPTINKIVSRMIP